MPETKKKLKVLYKEKHQKSANNNGTIKETNQNKVCNNWVQTNQKKTNAIYVICVLPNMKYD